MGESAAQTVREIEDTRGKLETELRELEDRLPEPKAVARRAAVVGGGAVAATAGLVLVRRTLRARRAKRAAARARTKVVLRALPDRVATPIGEVLEADQWKVVVAGVGVVWFVLRVAELRQLRRLNRVLAVR